MRQIRTIWPFRHSHGMLGCVLIGLITFVCYRLQLNFNVTGFIYLIVIVLQSLAGSFASSAVVSVVAVLCLDFSLYSSALFFRGYESSGHPGADFVFDYGAGHYPTHYPSAQGGSDLGSSAASGGSTVPVSAKTARPESRNNDLRYVDRTISRCFWSSGGLPV